MYDLKNRHLIQKAVFPLRHMYITCNCFGIKKSALGRFFRGGRSVTLLEPTYIIADWFLNSNNWSMIKLQEQSADERRKQILEMNYVF